jgi:hypothetical protein
VWCRRRSVTAALVDKSVDAAQKPGRATFSLKQFGALYVGKDNNHTIKRLYNSLKSQRTHLAITVIQEKTDCLEMLIYVFISHLHNEKKYYLSTK